MNIDFLDFLFISGMIVVTGRQVTLAGNHNKQSLADLSMGKINDSSNKAVVNRTGRGKRNNTDTMMLIASTVQILSGIYRHHVGMVSWKRESFSFLDTNRLFDKKLTKN